MNYAYIAQITSRKTVSRYRLLFIFIYFIMVMACTGQDDSKASKSEVAVEVDLSKLPANLRRRLAEGESRIKVLIEQKLVLVQQLETLEQLERQYQSNQSTSPRLLSEAQARVAEANQRLDLHEQSLSELTNLVQRIKLQALADEMTIDQQSDERLTSFLSDAIEVYDELGQFSTIQREAKLGQAEAQYTLGRRYEKGIDVDQSDHQAFIWYVKAANQGHEKAALASGFFYRHGKGTAKDIDKSITFYTIAAELGNLMAANNLGLIYLDLSRNSEGNRHQSRHTRSAKKWFIMAASGGVKSAQLNLAKLYLDEARDQPEKSLSKYEKAQDLLRKAQKSKREKIRTSAEDLLKQLTNTLQPKLKQNLLDTLRWVQIPQGSFVMGDSKGQKDAQLTRSISVAAFSLLATEVTVEQYQSCVVAEQCSPIRIEKKGCTHRRKESKRLPVTCISWDQARDFAGWIGGDLPSEVQWEYAARSAGQFTRYPWGDTSANCDLAVMRVPDIRSKKSRSSSGSGCGQGGAWPVCSKSTGMSRQGICDLIGNVWEWTLDEYRPAYDPKQLDDLPVCLYKECKSSADVKRVIRGAGYMTKVSGATATIRSKSDRAATGIGFRVAKRTLNHLQNQ